jgi:hypothetical protein
MERATIRIERSCSGVSFANRNAARKIDARLTLRPSAAGGLPGPRAGAAANAEADFGGSLSDAFFIHFPKIQTPAPSLNLSAAK